MLADFWEMKDIASKLGVTIRVAEHAMKRDGIEPIARSARLRLYHRSQVEQAAAALARTRSYEMTPRYSTLDLSTSPGSIGHTSALGISIETGADETTAQSALDDAGIAVDHIEQDGEQMYRDSDTAAVVAALKAKKITA